jgi:hypothetical protein
MVKEALCDIFAGTQLAYGTPGGCEKFAQLIQSKIYHHAQDKDYGIASADIANAFNTTNRLACYNEVLKHSSLRELVKIVYFAYSNPTLLHVLDSASVTHTLISETGTRQGDPLGMVLFCLAAQPVYTDVAKSNGVSLLAYADDPIIDGKIDNVFDALELLRSESKAKLNLTLNQNKTKFYFPYAKNSSELDPYVIDRVKSFGGEICFGMMEIVRCPVGLDEEMMRSWCTNKVKSKADLMLKALVEDNKLTIPLQHTILLLKICYSQQMNYLCRCLPPRVFSEAAAHWDKCLESLLERFVGFGPDAPDTHRGLFSRTRLQWHLCILPARNGFPGLGIPSAEVVNEVAYCANVIESLPALSKAGTVGALLESKDNYLWGGSYIAHVLNYLSHEECFTKLQLVKPGYVFKGEPDELISIFHRQLPEQKHVRTRRLKLQQVLTASRHSLALRDLLETNYLPDNADYADIRSATRVLIRASCDQDSGLILRLIPSDAAHTLSDDDFRFFCRNRLGAPLVHPRELPAFCAANCKRRLSPNDPFASFHLISCQKFKGFERYALHQNIVHESKRWTLLCGLHCTAHPSAFITNINGEEKDGTRPDLIAYPSDDRKIASDATCNSPMADSYRDVKITHRSESAKTTKHAQRCDAQGMDFYPLAVTTSGGIGKSAQAYIKKIHAAAPNKVPTILHRRRLVIEIARGVKRMCYAVMLRAKHQAYKDPAPDPYPVVDMFFTITYLLSEAEPPVTLQVENSDDHPAVTQPESKITEVVDTESSQSAAASVVSSDLKAAVDEKSVRDEHPAVQTPTIPDSSQLEARDDISSVIRDIEAPPSLSPPLSDTPIAEPQVQQDVLQPVTSPGLTVPSASVETPVPVQGSSPRKKRAVAARSTRKE